MTAQSLGRRIAALAAAQPERPAVISIDAVSQRGTVLTWSQLDVRSRGVTAAVLHAVPESAGERPVVWTPAANSTDGVVALLGVLRAGLTVASLDASAPLIDRERHLGAIAQTYGGVVALHDLVGEEEDRGEAHAGSSTEVDDVVRNGSWILMTGGSTGIPHPIDGPGSPAWAPEHGPPLLLRRAGWRAGQVQLVLGPLHHAAPFTSLIDGVLSGNSIVITNGYYPRLLFDLVDEYNVEWIQVTPVHMRMADPLLDARGRQLHSLRAVLHTAAPCPADTKRRWIDVLGDERVFEMYAATEGIGTTLCTGREWLERPGTVGRGFLTRIRVLDEQRRDLPSGEVGEVYMRSVRSSPGSRHYDGMRGFQSVGDHGRLDADGYLYLSGRGDDLVIVGGENVYLGEVETALLAHNEVSDAAVVAVSDDALQISLNAYVVARDGARLDERGLQRHCRQQLPAPKRPRNFRVVNALPRNPAGKLMRRELESWPNS